LRQLDFRDDAGRASRSEAAATQSAVAARENARQAEVRVAEGLVSQGDALVLAGRRLDADAAYHEAYRFGQHHADPVRAEAAMACLYNGSPPALLTMRGHAYVTTVAFSPDGRAAVSGSLDKTLKLWDLATGKEIRTLRGHPDYVNSVAISFDGRTALSGSWDKTLKLWDLASGKEIRTLQGHTGPVTSVAISPDGRTVLSGSEDKTVRIWDFGRAARYIEFEATLPAAQAALQKDSNDAGGLAVLGDWYAFRGRNDWAIEFLEKARAGWAAIDPLTLGRCYWELAGELPSGSTLTPGQGLAAAEREYRAALAAATDEPLRQYLTLCLDAIGREAAAGPATKP
jgi:tetratricopeptide (TPR) repeat protein